MTVSSLAGAYGDLIELCPFVGAGWSKPPKMQKPTKEHKRSHDTVSQNVMNITAWYVRPTVLYPTMSN